MLKDVFYIISRLFFSVSFLLLLTSCIGVFYGRHGVSVYHLPDGVEGRLCVAECTRARNSCADKCNQRGMKCGSRKQRALSTIRNMIGFVRGVIKDALVLSESRKAFSGSCKAQRNQCYSSCSSDGNCSSLCETEYKSCSSSRVDMSIGFRGKGGVFMPSEDVCDTQKCVQSCENDYSECFVKCGGSVYLEVSDPGT